MMETRRSDDGRTFHFISRSQRLSETVVKAVAFVKGVDPMDLEPLGNFIDPSALDVIFAATENGVISFEMDGLDVRVHSTGEVKVTDPSDPQDTYRTVHDEFDDISNILLLAQSHEDETCSDLFLPAPVEDVTVLFITLSQSADDRMRVWNAYAGNLPQEGCVITAGEFPRSATDGLHVLPPAAPGVTIASVESPEHLADLGILIKDRLSEWEDSEKQLVACFYSITELLQHVNEERVFRFLHLLTRLMEEVGVLAHYHLDPTVHDEVTVSKFATLFDTTVNVDDTGNWMIES